MEPLILIAVLCAALVGFAGFVGGALFSLILSLAERSGRPLSVLRGAAWGFVAWLLMFPPVVGINSGIDPLAAFFLPGIWSSALNWAFFGALFGASTAWIAQPRRAAPAEPADLREIQAPSPPSPLERDLEEERTPHPSQVL